MACIRADIERLAVRGEAGLSWNENAASFVLTSETPYDTALVRLSSKIDAYLLLLNRHVAIEGFTVDLVEVREEEEEEGGVLNYIQERLVGKRKKGDGKSKAEERLLEAWQVCEVRDYGGVHVLAKVTPEVMPQHCNKDRYSAGQYGEALLHGLRSYYMFDCCHALFQPDAVGLWGGGGSDCMEPVIKCYLVLAWRIAEQGKVGVTSRIRPSLTVTATTAATATKRQGHKRGTETQNIDEEPLTPAKKKMKVGGWDPAPLQASPAKGGSEEVILTPKQKRDIIPVVQYSPDIIIKQGVTHPKHSPQKSTNQSPASSARQTNEKVMPQKSTNERTPQKAASQDADDLGELANVTFGFERATPKGRRQTTQGTPRRKSVLLPNWSEEEKNILMRFFDTLNPNHPEQTRVALTCKFASMQFGQELPSKHLYQMIQQKGRSVHPPLDSYTLPGGLKAARAAAAELFHSLNPKVTESKRVAFTCRFMQTQYGVDIKSKELYNILSGEGKMR
ncbi:hypothetical protein O3P69_009249 [Scylla paramamosain]|uniref:Uncharacterized protein n=1 Tax=Scylla paramamosain TaxID=85552 RepID=A0AAW0TAF8_SCYPA